VGALPLVLIVVVGVALAYFGYRSWQQEQKRRELLMMWATNSGFSFAAEDDGWCDRWHASPFGEGDHRRARNVITGMHKERAFVAFDYSYETHSSNGKGGQTTTTHRYVVTSLQLPGYLPQLQVTPENVMTRLGNALGLDDIELESEDFNRRFRVHAQDRKFACDVLSPRTMQMLLSRPASSWRIDGSDILAWQDGRLSPALCLATTSQLQDIVDGIPSFVWHDREIGGTA
jgi:Protein of unknown function (DUF3137)